jgi:sugar phosphate isomerase/epimerase
LTSGDPDALSRFSLNQMTVDQWSLDEAIEACAAAGVRWMAPWRHKLADRGAGEYARLLQEAGIRASSLCRGGFFGAPGADEDNRRAVEEAAELGTDVLVLVCGPAPGRDLRVGRRIVAEGVERLLPYAIDHGVRLAIEPLHPMLVAERSVIVTLGEALDLAERFDEDAVGVVVDAYHVFWDPDVERQIVRAGRRILAFHISDWVTPMGDATASRAMIGDGAIDLRRLIGLVDRAGYLGPIEAEIINTELRSQPGADVFELTLERFAQLATASS